MKTMERFTRYLGYIGLGFTAVSCSTATERCTDVNQDRIHQSYTAEYDQSGDKTSVTAQFRFGDGTGTTLELVGNCNVTHSVYSMSKQSFLGTSYTGSGTGLQASHAFVFTNNDSRRFQNGTSIGNIAFDNPPTTISKVSGASIAWTGGAIAQDETVSITFEDAASNAVVIQSTSTSTVGATSITVTSTNLSRIPNGGRVMYLKRSKNTSLTEAASPGGSITARYVTTKANVTIAE